MIAKVSLSLMSLVKEVLISVTTVVKKKIYEYSLKSHPDKDQ